MGNLFGNLFRYVHTFLWFGTKAVCCETLGTGVKILTDILENHSPEVSAGDIISKHVTIDVQNLIGKLPGRDRNRVRRVVKSVMKTKRARVIKMVNLSSFTLFTLHNVWRRDRVH